MGFVMDRVENIVGKGENAGYQRYQHLFLFQQNLQNPFSTWLFKVGIVW